MLFVMLSIIGGNIGGNAKFTLCKYQKKENIRNKAKYGEVLDNIFKTHDIDTEFIIDYNKQQQGTFSDSDDDVLVNMDEAHGVGVTLQ